MIGTSNGFQMIRSIDIKNFRCYEHLHIDDCKRINVIVGENGSGKTALLEAIFLTLANGSEVAMRFRQLRGLDGNFRGTSAKIAKAIWSDFFFHGNLNEPINIQLIGDGPEARSLSMSKTRVQFTKSLNGNDETIFSGPVVLTWTPAQGFPIPVTPVISASGLQLPETGEDLDSFYYFPATAAISSTEIAERFSELSRKGIHLKFVESFKKEYPFVADIGIEALAGTPAVFVSLKHTSTKIPLANLSGSINRLVAILLSISAQEKGVFTIDEIENGIYYRHQESMWRQILEAVRNTGSQIFATTHSLECLKALVSVTNGKTDDIALWRIERDEKGKPELLQFDGSALASAAELDVEVRGGADISDD